MLASFRRSARLAFFFVMGAAAFGAQGCHTQAPSLKGGSPAPKTIDLSRGVEVTRASQRSLVYRVETVGLLEAEGQTEIAAGVTGIVDQVLFREGDQVAAGQVIATVDQDRYKADYELAKAAVDRAKASLDLAKDLWERSERAGRGLSDEDRAKARGNLNVAQAEQRTALAALARASVTLDRSRVRSPYAGRINKRNVTKGSYLEERTTIATIADLSKMRLVGYVPESAAPIVRELINGQQDRLKFARPAVAWGASPSPMALATALTLIQADYIPSGSDPEFEVLALPGHHFLGRIFYLSTVANAETHMFECKAEVVGWSNPASESSATNAQTAAIDHVLWPGFTAKITFPLRSNPNAVVIPEEAVRNTERGHVVFVPKQVALKDGKSEWIAKLRVVELGFRGDGNVEVRSGLAPGERIIQRGAEAVEDGTRIRFAGS